MGRGRKERVVFSRSQISGSLFLPTGIGKGKMTMATPIPPLSCSHINRCDTGAAVPPWRQIFLHYPCHHLLLDTSISRSPVTAAEASSWRRLSHKLLVLQRESQCFCNCKIWLDPMLCWCRSDPTDHILMMTQESTNADGGGGYKFFLEHSRAHSSRHQPKVATQTATHRQTQASYIHTQAAQPQLDLSTLQSKLYPHF